MHKFQTKFLCILVVLSTDWIRCITTETSQEISETIKMQDDLNSSLVEDLQNLTLVEILKDFESIKNGMTKLINQLRSCHQVNSFQRTDFLDSKATDWAQTMASTGEFTHSNNHGWGENIYWQSWPLGPNGFNCVQQWYCECFSSYRYDTEDNSSKCFHFTQLVWKESSAIGLGIAQGSQGFYVVANFDPPGNWIGRFRKNVFQPNMNCVQSVMQCPST